MTENIKKPGSKLVIAWVLSILSLPFGLVFSGIFINIIQKFLSEQYRYLPLIFGGLLLFFVSPQFSLFYLSIGLLVSIYNLSLKKGINIFYSALLAVLVLALIYSLFFFYYFVSGDLSMRIMEYLFLNLIDNFSNLGFLNQAKPLKIEDIRQLIYQIPSIFAVMCALCLFFTSIFENSSKSWFGLTFNSSLSKLNHFALPGYMIWVLILSLAGAYIDMGVPAFKILSLNLLNMSILCYFFQGFAVLFNLFEVFKVSLLSKFFVVFCFVVQFSFITVIIGILDYWFNFRGQFIKKAKEFKQRSGL